MEANFDRTDAQPLLAAEPSLSDKVAGEAGHDLHGLLAMGFAGMIALSFGLSVLLAWQIRVAHLQTTQNRTVVATFQKVDEPQVRMVLTKLQAFSVQHPAFGAVLQKYPIFFTARPLTNAPAGPSGPPATGSKPAGK
jgi:hypothetical protein